MFAGLKHKTAIFAVAAIALLWVAPAKLNADKKKKDAAPAADADTVKIGKLDLPDVVFPLPPAIARVRYMDYYSAQKLDSLHQHGEVVKKETKKAGWMDRLAGVGPETERKSEAPKFRFQLMQPYGVAVDSKGMLYVADTKVGAIFIFNPENSDLTLIKNGADARFRAIFGLAIDDADNLFVADGALRHVLVFDSNHKLQMSFGEHEMKNPCGIAIDNDNRLIYVVDTDLDQVLVYDADSYKLLRKIGTTGKDHTLRSAGNFSKPTNAAVDKDGNLYVSDTLNDRIEVFDAEGNFVREWGKNGDALGDFARPKGVAIDSDGHVWVSDAMLNRMTVFTPEGQPLLGFGGFGGGPGQFQAMTGVAFDAKNNRLFAAEQLYSRVQMFRYVTNAEARAELEKKQAAMKKKAEDREAAKSPKPAETSAAPAAVPAASEQTAK